VRRVAWSEQAKADVRGLDKPTAVRILHALHRFVETGAGDIKRIQGGGPELRPRVGDTGCSSSAPATM